MSDNIDDIIRRASATVRRNNGQEEEDHMDGELSDQQKEQKKAAFYAEEQKEETKKPQSLEDMLSEQLRADKPSKPRKPKVAVYEVDQDNKVHPVDPASVNTGIPELDDMLHDLNSNVNKTVEALADEKMSGEIPATRQWKIDDDADDEIQKQVDKLYELCEKYELPAVLQIQTSMQSKGYTVKGFRHKLPFRSTCEMDLLVACLQILFSNKQPSNHNMIRFMSAIADMLKETE